ncbi:transcriptional regulator [Caloranaerobacter azorensis H53214]|uniref:Transcriptional regulator n=1 Tax=Caloranaerobacter azorensis H53214 TaxID=1156417 RepID=A0A096BGH5_9FIRM|nr:transcriptional regulator [Caloranaerobacter azorensis H53214]
MYNMISKDLKRISKNTNQSLVLNTVRQKGPISRAEIARITGLTPPTVTNITAKLLKYQLIVEYKIGESSGGRRPLLLKMNPDAINVIVIYVGPNRLIGYLSSGDINVLKRQSYEITRFSKEEIIELMFTVISNLKENSNAEVPGIGVVMHGPVKSEEGISIFAPNLGWRNVPIKYIIENKFHIPVFVENDVRTMTLGELYYGSARGKNSMIFLNIGYGIGSAIILDGKLYRGCSDSAGEVGHTTIDVSGPKCSCGNYGCFEAMASERALVKYVVKDIKEGRKSLVEDMVNGNLEYVTPEIIYEAAHQGDLLAQQYLLKIARYIGIALANIINTFNPELIILGGGIVKAKSIIKETIIDMIKQRALESSYKVSKIQFSNMGEEAVFKGAVDIVMSNIF